MKLSALTRFLDSREIDRFGVPYLLKFVETIGEWILVLGSIKIPRRKSPSASCAKTFRDLSRPNIAEYIFKDA